MQMASGRRRLQGALPSFVVEALAFLCASCSTFAIYFYSYFCYFFDNLLFILASTSREIWLTSSLQLSASKSGFLGVNTPFLRTFDPFKGDGARPVAATWFGERAGKSALLPPCRPSSLDESSAAGPTY